MTQNRTDGELSDRSAPKVRGHRLRLVVGGIFILALCAAIRYYWGAEPAEAAQGEPAVRRTNKESDTPAPARKAQPASRPSQPKAAAEAKKQAAVAPASSKDGGPLPAAIVATVNMQRITRKELAQECRKRYGADVLESMVNKYLIQQECTRLGVEITNADIEAEIKRMADRFKIPVDQWVKMIKQERNVSPEQYANDIIWPTLALRRLAGERLSVTKKELKTEYEIQYGEAVRARLIAVNDPEKAKKLQAEASANPEEFGDLAKDYSEDAPSASAKGVIQPIRKHGSYQEIEDAVFNMDDGQVSPVIQAGGQYVILKRERLIPARQVDFEEVAPKLTEIIRDRKMRSVSQDVFRDLQQEAKVENIWNDPAKHAQTPDVAATINGDAISIADLDEECILRKGQETLEGMISRKLLEQDCKRRSITVSEEDIDAEVGRAALAGVKPNADGSPDVEAWLDLVTKKQGIPIETYRNDIVWPSVALKKLVGDQVKITEEDLKKGFDANYGPRVRCLAIVLDNQRRAQQVFEMARKNNTPEYFGKLATEYSIEAGSRELHGEVPPIRKYGGQPQLEEEAFALKPGELSGIIQVGDKFIILRCEEYTKPTTNIAFDEVREIIYEDLHEKKLRIEMAGYFEDIQEAAVIDNYLAGTSHSPKDKKKEDGTKMQMPSLHQVPGN